MGFLQMFAHAIGGRVRPQTPHPSVPLDLNAAEFRTDILKSVILTASENYKEYARITSIMDDKAQKTIQTAGVFLGAAFAFIKPGAENVKHAVGLTGLLLLALVVSALVLSVVFGLAVMRVRSFPSPITAEALDKMRNDLAHVADLDLSADHRTGFLGEQIRIWLGSLDNQRWVNSCKGAWLGRSQLALGAAMVFVTMLLFLVLVITILS